MGSVYVKFIANFALKFFWAYYSSLSQCVQSYVNIGCDRNITEPHESKCDLEIQPRDLCLLSDLRLLEGGAEEKKTKGN